MAEHTHLLFLPLGYVLITGSAYWLMVVATDDGFIRPATTEPQLLGTLTLYALLPAYLLAMTAHQRRRTLETLTLVQPITRAGDADRVRQQLDRLPAPAWIAILAGFAFGAAQNPEVLQSMYQSGEVYALDVGFLLGACVVWAMVAAVLC